MWFRSKKKNESFSRGSANSRERRRRSSSQDLVSARSSQSWWESESIPVQPKALADEESLQHRVLELVGMDLTGAQTHCLEDTIARYLDDWRPRLINMALMHPLPARRWFQRGEQSDLPSRTTDVNDEELLMLVRFCVARQFKLDAVMEMILAYLEFRESHAVDITLCKSVTVETVQRLRRSYPNGFYGTTRDGAPVYYDRCGQIDVKQLLNDFDLKEVESLWIQSYEFSQQVVMPACSLVAGRRITRGITIMDLEGLGWSQMNASGRSVLKTVIRISQDFYPEAMEALYICNASFMVQAALKFVQPFLDPKTQSKIHVLPERGDNLERRLSTILDPADIPPFLIDKTQRDNNNWIAQPKGPWCDAGVLRRLKTHFPLLENPFLYSVCHLVDSGSNAVGSHLRTGSPKGDQPHRFPSLPRSTASSHDFGTACESAENGSLPPAYGPPPASLLLPGQSAPSLYGDGASYGRPPAGSHSQSSRMLSAAKDRGSSESHKASTGSGVAGETTTEKPTKSSGWLRRR